MISRTTLTSAVLIAGAALVARPTLAEDEPVQPPQGWFTDVSEAAGLTGQRAKDCVLTDLDGDGWWDLVLDNRDVYLSRAKGTRFERVTEHGIELPEVETIPVADDGTLQRDKARRGPFVPQYVYFADIDNDGDPDALWGVKSSWEWFDGTRFVAAEEADHGLRSRVYLNDGTGRFARGPESGYTARDAVGPVMALAVVDTDRDGALDLFEGREYRRYGVLWGCGVDRLWKGDGKGGFTDVTDAAGLTTVPEPALDTSSRPTYGVTHADVDGDGWQDLLALSYGRQWNRLWHNDGDGTFTDVGRATWFAGDDVDHGKYPEWLQDVYRRRGNPERPAEAPFRANGNTFDCAVGDVDNDGDLDLLLGEITHAWAGESSDLSALLVNDGAGFTRKTVHDLLPPRTRRDDSSWNNGDLHTAMADLDNDGLMDLLIASGDYPDGQYLRVYRQHVDGSFADVTTDLGLTWEGCGSLSLGDYDRDGDVDIVIGRSFMRLSKAHRDAHMGGLDVNQVGLLRNDVANRSGNHWLNVRLNGKTANRSGIGARIEVTAGGRTWIREIRCGSGLANHQDPPEACFGLGKAATVESLVVRWPDAKGSVDTYEDVPVDRFVVVTQGAERPSLSTE